MAVGWLDPKKGFSLDQTETDEQLDRRRRMAQALYGQGMQTGPVGSAWEGAARMAQALVGAYQMRKANEGEASNQAYNSNLLSGLFATPEGVTPGASGGAFPSSVAAGGSTTAPAATGGAGALPPEVVKAGLVARGLPEHVADGFVMNFQDESGLNPSINEKNPIVAGSRGGYGLYQLTGPRRRAYEAYAQERGVPVDSPDAQMDFLVSELQGPEKGAAEKIFSTQDPGSAAAAITKYFLRPAAEHQASRIAKYTRNPQTFGVQTASLDPSMADVAQGYAPPPNPTVAEALATPAVGGAVTGQPMLVSTPEGNRMESGYNPTANTSPNVQPYSGPGATVGVGNVPAGGGGTPVLDVTQVPQLSAAAGLPFATSDGAVAAPMPTQPAPVAAQSQASPVAQALAIRAQAAPGDAMVAGADQTLQPTAQELQSAGIAAPQADGAFPPAPTMPSRAAQLQSVIADPRANAQTKNVAMALLQQDQAQAQAAAKAQADQQQWLARQQFEQQQRQNDPSYLLDLEKKRRDLSAPTTPDSVRALQERATLAGLQPGTPEYQQFMINGGAADGGVTVNNNMGSDKFNEEFAKADAKTLSDTSQAGLSAQRNIGRIDQLAKLLETTPSGWAGAAKQAAGEWGINVDGLDNIQATQAIINSLVPEQRPPGSGPMSDADLALFKQSLPRIINSPGGNQIIINTMRAIAQYDAEGAAIVQRTRLPADQGGITRAQAFEMLQARANPLANIKLPGDNQGGGQGNSDIPQPAQGGGGFRIIRRVN